MPEKEREALLRRLKQSVRSDNEERDEKYHREVAAHEREDAISKEMARLSIFARFILWLKSKFKGRSTREVYVAMRVKALKRKINSKFPGITGFETRDLSPMLAEEVFRIYTLAVPLREFYSCVWTEPIDLQNIIVALIEARVSRAVRSMDDLISNDKLQEIVRAGGSKEAIKEEVGRRLTAYIDGIPKAVFASVREDMKPFERTRDMVLYPFASFFQLFHFTPTAEDLNKRTYFKNASAMLCLEHLERLHHALYAVTTIPEHFQLADDIVSYVSVAASEEEVAGAGDEAPRVESAPIEEELPEVREAPGEPGDGGEEVEGSDGEEEESQETSTGAAAARARLEELLPKMIERCRALYEKMPFEALIQYFMKDPYYRLVHEFQETPTKELYVSVLRLRFVAEIERIYPHIRKRVLEKEIQALFAGKTLRTFRNYREYASIDYKKLGLPFFSHTRSVMLLFNYVNWFYKGYVQEAVQLLDKNVLGQNRITKDRLVQYAESVEDTAERIRQFDYSLSSDSEDGRTFQRLRFTLAQDTGHQKMYRTLVLQKDREVRSILDRGIEALNGLSRVFQDLLQSSSPNIRASMQNHYFVRGQPVSLDDIVRERIDHMRRFVRLLDQVIRLERA